MLEHAVTVRLRKELAEFPEKPSPEAKAALRQDVLEFVDMLKTKGVPVERVIIAIKQLAAEAGLRSSADVLRLSARLKVRDELLLDVVRWAVERFYGYERPPRPGGTGSSRKGPGLDFAAPAIAIIPLQLGTP
jgi:hypothetical protein